ncbi:MAG: hypothetical protein V3V02_08965 [Rhizobiaceae bacterium]
MKIFGIVVLAIVVVIAFGLGWFNTTVSWNQKLTVTVETPQGVVSASSVTSVFMKGKDGFLVPPEASGLASSLKGEAVAVDLGKGKYLFVLLKGTMGIAGKIFLKESGWNQPHGKWPKWAENIARLRGKREIPIDLLPMLVTFSDITRPASVKKVNPNNLRESFGSGYRLKSMTLEITDEPVTKGVVEGVLGWIYTVKGRIKPYAGRTRALADVPEVELLNKYDFVIKKSRIQ